MLGIFSGGGGDQQPQLMNPIFYAGNSAGAAGYGLLAVPYASFQQTYQYYTSWNPTRIPCTDQSGLIYVASCDSVQKGVLYHLRDPKQRFDRKCPAQAVAQVEQGEHTCLPQDIRLSGQAPRLFRRAHPSLL